MWLKFKKITLCIVWYYMIAWKTAAREMCSFSFFKKYARSTTSKPIKRKVSPSLVSRIITGHRLQNTASNPSPLPIPPLVMLYTYIIGVGFSVKHFFLSIPSFHAIDIFIRFARSLCSPIDCVLYTYIHEVENFARQFSSWPVLRRPYFAPFSVTFRSSYDCSLLHWAWYEYHFEPRKDTHLNIIYIYIYIHTQNRKQFDVCHLEMH